MSRMGRVVQEVMEMHDGDVPVGYTLSDYFRDVKKKNQKKTASRDREDINDIPETNEEKSQRPDR